MVSGEERETVGVTGLIAVICAMDGAQVIDLSLDIGGGYTHRINNYTPCAHTSTH